MLYVRPLLVCTAVAVLQVLASFVGDEELSLVQADHQPLSVPGDVPECDYDDDAHAEAIGVSQLQLRLHIEPQTVEADSAPVVSHETQPQAVASSSEFSALVKTALHDDEVSFAVAPSDPEKSTWLGQLAERLSVRSWQIQQWASFAFCLLVLQCVVWMAMRTRRKSKGSKKKSRVTPQRLSLSLPLRQLIEPNSGPVKLLGSSDGPAYVATLHEDESGERTLQLAEAAEPTQVIMSVGPFTRAGVLEDGAAVHRYTQDASPEVTPRGCDQGVLQSTGPSAWSLSNNGRTTLQISSSAPFVLTMRNDDLEPKEVAWIKPMSKAKEPDYVDLTISEGGDSVLPVACAVAVLVASSSTPFVDLVVQPIIHDCDACVEAGFPAGLQWKETKDILDNPQQ